MRAASGTRSRAATTWLPCFDFTAHSGESAIFDHLRCLEARLYYSLNDLIPDAAELAAAARRIDRRDLEVQAELISLDTRTRMGESAAVKAGLLELLAQVPLGSAVSGRIKMVLSTTSDRLGERTEAARWIREALAGWPAGEMPSWRAQALMVSALNGMSRTNVDYSLVHHAVAEVTEHGDPFLLAATLANFAEVSAECGDLAVSAQFADAASAMLRRHPELTAVLTLDSIGRSRLALGELTAAQYALENALSLEEELHCSDVQGDPWLTYAEILLALGDADAGWAVLEEPARKSWAAQCSWTRSRDLKLRAEILAAQGHWREAYRTLVEHLAEYEGLRSVEGDRAVAEFSTVQLADEERRRAAEFERLALTDSLTGLPNRRRAERWLAELTDHSVSLAIIDLDHFKRINDDFSHDSGDEVLRRIGQVLTDSVTGPDVLLARLGGEEFVQLCRGVSRADAIERAEQLMLALRGLQLDEIAPGLRVTASIGVAFGDPLDAPNLLRAADRCLYAAKRAGRDQIVIAD